MSNTDEAQEEVERFLQKGEKIGAIKHLMDTYGFSLEESKILVEAMEEEQSFPPDHPYLNSDNTTLDGSAVARISQLLYRGMKIQAIRYVMNSSGARLKEAKKMVEEVERSLPPRSRTPARIMLLLFGAVGFVMLGVAGYVFFNQTQSIETSDLVTGRVIRMQTKSDGMSAPVIEYEWTGQKWLHASKTYSSPPAYDVGEEVPMYVNRENPEDVTLDTFLGRWFLITIVGSLGLLFTGIAVLVGWLSRDRRQNINSLPT